MTKPVVNISDVVLQPRSAASAVPGGTAERYEAAFGRIGARVGAKQLGHNITAVPPGKRAFPFHNHRVNEEMFVILRGTGEIRIGMDTYPLRSGDVIACPAGGIETAHQIVNTGQEELRYLAVSTQRAPEIWEYPDSGKFGVVAEFTSPGSAQSGVFPYFARGDHRADYWNGE